MEIRDPLRDDGDELRAPWRACGIRDRPGDDDASLAAMASRNPGLCIVGYEEGRIVASALAGFDTTRWPSGPPSGNREETVEFAKELIAT